MTIYAACGGCGAQIPEERCFGCFHDFGGDSPKVVQPQPVAPDLLAEIETLKAKLDTANALVTCCCGNPVDKHGMGDGHSPVDQYHYAMHQMEKRVETLEANLAAFRAAWSHCVQSVDPANARASFGFEDSAKLDAAMAAMDAVAGWTCGAT